MSAILDSLAASPASTLAPSARPLPATRPLPARPLPARPLPAAGGTRLARGVLDNATLVDRLDLTAGLAIFTIRPDGGPLRFQPGQYVSLALRVDGSPVLRPYSIASPDDGRADFELLIRRADDGALTSRLWALDPGARLFVGPPRGVFTVLADDAREHLLVGAGTGLAPLMAMLARLAERQHPPRTVLLHGASHATELAYAQRLRAWADQGWLDYRPSVSRPEDAESAGWRGLVGRIDVQLERALAEPARAPGDMVAYLCGNDGMVRGARELLAGAGVPPSATHAESFTPARRAPGVAA